MVLEIGYNQRNKKNDNICIEKSIKNVFSIIISQLNTNCAINSFAYFLSTTLLLAIKTNNSFPYWLEKPVVISKTGLGHLKFFQYFLFTNYLVPTSNIVIIEFKLFIANTLYFFITTFIENDTKGSSILPSIRSLLVI